MKLVLAVGCGEVRERENGGKETHVIGGSEIPTLSAKA
jgi:hypothetical protein